jgi:beta-glucosidase
VLLKNRNNLLPIQDSAKSVLVVGPNASNINVLLGNYYGINTGMVTFLEGIAGRAPEGMRVEFMPGSLLANEKRVVNDWSVHSAPAADITVAFMGLSPLLEGEEGEAILSDNGDREEIALPKPQLDYLRKLATSGARVVLVLSGGSPIALDGLEDLVDAILYVWYPGQEGGNAVAQVLFGDVNPSGKLPLTFPKSLKDLPPFEDYAMQSRTHRYASVEPLFPFGFGLSYTRFEYSNLTLDRQTVPAGQSLTATLTLTNCGTSAGEETVQVYLKDLAASVPVPNQSLVDFQRVALEAGESKTLEFTLTPEKMMLVDDDGKLQLESGSFRIEIGGASPGTRSQALGASRPVSAEFTLA